MRILFVWPNKDQFGFKPISLSLLSAQLKRNGHIVDLFDTTGIDFGFKTNTETRSKIRIFKEVDYGNHDISKKKADLEQVFTEKLVSFKPDIVGISALSDEIHIGFTLSRTAKKWNKNVTVIWGNKTATMAPEKVLSCPEVDYVCIGEGIDFMPEFVSMLEKNMDPTQIPNLGYRDKTGAIMKNSLRPYFQDLDTLPYLDWTIFDDRHFLKPFDGNLYRGGDYMMYWGCPNQCTYCINSSYRKLYGKNAGGFLRKYSVNRIIEELVYLKKTWKIEFLKFHDEDFCLKPMDYFSQLAEEYAQKVNIPFTIMANARNITKEKILLLKKMNCVSISIGIENGNVKLRKEILKRTETPEEIINAVRMLNDAGIRTAAFNMLGIPFETRQTIMETIKLNRDANIQVPDTVFFFPLENTPLRNIAIKNGNFNADSTSVFQTDKSALTFPDLSNQELTALRERFILYVKFPDEFYPYITRSEKSDDIGKKLTQKLYMIYDECVFANNGFWNNALDSKSYLKELHLIVQTA